MTSSFSHGSFVTLGAVVAGLVIAGGCACFYAYHAAHPTEHAQLNAATKSTRAFIPTAVGRPQAPVNPSIHFAHFYKRVLNACFSITGSQLTNAQTLGRAFAYLGRIPPCET